MFFLDAANEGFLNTFKFDSRNDPRVPYSIVMSSPVISYVKMGGECAILDGSGYDTATALIAWEVMRTVNWSAVAPATSFFNEARHFLCFYHQRCHSTGPRRENIIPAADLASRCFLCA